ncbi:unnamed protein product [Brassicogethes aeneus]|uniref:SCP domain-containing protein n=1 Tax=Brassicogethes aeneus TaxID=1431903 RepID=A0A9P0BDC3_BRAAE|nr:unnamed protein product [Brassicogethes aeneus]
MFVVFLAVLAINYSEATCPYGTITTGVSSTEQTLIVNLHNNVRLKVARGTVPNQPRGINLKKLYWNACLASEAQRIANSCVFASQTATCPTWSKIGQILYIVKSTSSSNRNSDWTSVITSWYNEYK